MNERPVRCYPYEVSYVQCIEGEPDTAMTAASDKTVSGGY